MKKLYQYKLVILATVCIHFTAMGQQKKISIQELQNEMQQKTANIESISCDFKQNKHLKYLDAVVESEGKLCFDKNNRLRWEYLTPFEYLIVINQGKFSIKTDGRVSEYDTKSNKIFTQISDLMISSVNGTIFTDPNFSVSAFVEKGEYIIYLEPNIKEMKDVISQIKLYINKSDFSVNKVYMFEREDDFTEIIFKNKKFNEALPECTFYCN